jgi:pimeloyl-ACP methyl ester carboxylesterase
LQADNWKLFREWSRCQGDHERHLRDLARPGALTSGLNWYRAAFLPPSPDEAPLPALPFWDRVRIPVLGIWSAGDPFLLEPQMAESSAVMEAPWRYERIAEAGHWLMLDQPEAVNQLLVDFLRT